jgi:hypothetical protein
MKKSVCSEFIHHLDQDGGLECGNAPEHIKAWFENLDLPTDLLRFMQWEWPQTDGFIAHIRILSSASLFAAKTTHALMKHKFMNAGSAPNGDMFVIDFSTEACAPGFITHEEWRPWSDEPKDPRKFFQPIARSFESFLFRVVEGRYIPTDYYAARDFNDFLANERLA